VLSLGMRSSRFEDSPVRQGQARLRLACRIPVTNVMVP
jgi:hypothetical protein